MTGEVTATIGETIVRGQTQTIETTVNGVTTTAGTITVASCTTDCPTTPTTLAKWGEEFPGGTGDVNIRTAVIPDAGTPVTVTDALTDTPVDESITGISWMAGYDCVDTWGAPGTTQPNGTCDPSQVLPVSSCDSETLSSDGQNFSCVLTTTVPNEFYSIDLNMTFTGSGPWTDQATSSYPGGPSQTTTATVTSYQAGGGATGTSPTSTGTTSTTGTAPTTATTGTGSSSTSTSTTATTSTTLTGTVTTTGSTGTTTPGGGKHHRGPSFAVLKTARISGPHHHRGLATVGDVIHYRILVTNTGTVAGTVYLTDSMFPSSRLDCRPQKAPKLHLAGGQHITCTVAVKVTKANLGHELRNVATIRYHTPSGTVHKKSTVVTHTVGEVSKMFEVDTFHMSNQGCATRVFRSLDLPDFDDGALDWTWATWYGHECFSGAWQILRITVPRTASSQAWISAIDSEITAKGVGKIHTTASLHGLRPGATTIAWTVPANGWLIGRPSKDRAPHRYFARS